MKQPITMRCNEYQFNEIKEKLKGNVSLKMLSKFNSNENFYLINHLCEEQNAVTNVVSPIKRDGVMFYEEWNEKIFLEACGIGVEKTYSITESQIKELSDRSIQMNIIMKEWFPESLKKQIKLESGKWYVGYHYARRFLVNLNLTDEIETHDTGYGFSEYGWTNDLSFLKTFDYGFEEATEQEVFEALKNEAVKRGFVSGCWIKRPDCFINKGSVKCAFGTEKYELFGSKNDKLQLNGSSIFENGVWAEVAITLSEAEQQLKKKIIV